VSQASKHPEKLDRFERGIVFRISRSIYVAFAVVGTLTIIFSGIVLGYALTPTLRGFDPDEPTPPGTQEVSPEEVLAAMSGTEVVEDWPEPVERPPTVIIQDDPNAAQIAELLEAIKEHFTAKKRPWRSKVTRYCARRDWWGDCSRWESKVLAAGAELRLQSAMESLSSADNVRLLTAVLVTVSSVESEEDRFLGLWTVTDLKAAYDRYPEKSLEALTGILTPVGPDGKPGTPPPDEYKTTVFRTILEITKASTQETTLVEFLSGLGSFAELTTNEQAVSLFSAVWTVLEGTETREAKRRMDALREVLVALKANHAASAAAVSGETQILAVATYHNLLVGKQENAAWSYAQEVSERNAAIAESNANYDAAKERKSGLRRTTLLSILGALGAIAVIGLLLGLLAVERNTRVLGELANRMATDQVPTAAVPPPTEQSQAPTHPVDSGPPANASPTPPQA